MKLIILLISVIGLEATMFQYIKEPLKDRSSRPKMIDQDVLQSSEVQARLIKRYPMPPQRERRVREWSTSRKEGWQGSKDSPIKNGSPQRPPPAKPPVLIHAAAKGPVRLEVTGGQRPPKKTVYKVPAGKTFNKEFWDAKKIRVDGSAAQENRKDGKTPRRGRIRLSSTGSKSYTALEGKLEGANKLESIGPDPTSKRGRFGTTEMDDNHKELVYFKPPRKTDSHGEVYQGGSIRNSSKDRQVTTVGILHGNSDNPMISARVSNSPSHSPPPSPGKPIFGSEHMWPFPLNKIGHHR